MRLGQDYLSSGNQGNSGSRRDQIDTKVNWNASSKLSMFVRFGLNTGDWYNHKSSRCWVVLL
ncbi:MAG: hypothetical protein ACJ74Y_18265 [Bryobacteraceae bacterium]